MPNKPELCTVNLGNVARGAALELFNSALDKVIANVADPSTDATAPREIHLKFKIKPDSDRRGLTVTTRAATKLAAVSDHTSRLYVGKDTEGNLLAFDQDPRQELLFESPKADENLLDFKTSS